MKFLIVGLGNPGEKYSNTRHNIGFKALDHVEKQANAFFVSDKYGSICNFKYKGRQIYLLKPNTFMNLSGTAVRYWMDKEKIVKDNILVVTDDLNLPLATLRLKKKGSDGGHNGLKNIQEKLNSNVYPRLRIGVGNDFPKGKQIDYVLGDWSAEELVVIEDKIETIKEMILGFCFNGLNNTMNTYNNK